MLRFSQTLLRLSGWNPILYGVEGKVRSIPNLLIVGKLAGLTTLWIENFAENLL